MSLFHFRDFPIIRRVIIPNIFFCTLFVAHLPRKEKKREDMSVDHIDQWVWFPHPVEVWIPAKITPDKKGDKQILVSPDGETFEYPISKLGDLSVAAVSNFVKNLSPFFFFFFPPYFSMQI